MALSSFIVIAQYGKIPFNHLTVEDGLSKGGNHFIYKDKTGFVWLSSVVGLNRYDGRSLKIYQPDETKPGAITGENIQSPFFEDEHNNLWFTTYYGGVNKYIRSTDSFESFISRDSSGMEEAGYYAFFLENNHKLWLIVDGHDLCYFDIIDKRYVKKTRLPVRILRANVHADDENRLKKIYAYSYQDTGLYLINLSADSINFKNYIGEVDPKPLEIKALWPVDDTLVWVGAVNGLYKFNEEKKSISHYAYFKNEIIKDIYGIAPFGENKLLIASQRKGLLIFDAKENRYKELFQPDNRDPYSLTNNDIVSINLDNDGGYWVSSEQLGVDYFSPEKKRFNSFIIENKVNDQLLRFKPSSLVEDENNNVWCSVEGVGIFILDQTGKIVNEIYQGDRGRYVLPKKEVEFLYKTKDERIWISTWDGMVVWVPDQKKIINLPFWEKIALSMCQLKDGRIILGTYGKENEGGLYQLVEKEPLNFNFEKITASDSTANYIFLWEDSRKNLFACNSLTSVTVMDLENDFKIKKELSIKGSAGAYFEDPENHSIWIGTSTGLFKINGELDADSLEHYTEDHGLPSRVIYGIIPDNQNRLWVSTNRGLVALELDSKNTQLFTHADGLLSTDFSDLSFLKHSNGEFWFGSSLGITKFLPQNIKPIKTAANPIVTNILINDLPAPDLRCAKTAATNISEIKQLNLDYLSNTVSFTFAALEYSDPTKNQFQYMLKGVDKDWVNSGTNNTTRYAKIPAGKYEFLLKASNSDGIWSKPRYISINIAPPFYKRNWFYFLMGIAVASFIWMVIRFRRNRREERRRMEEEKRKALELERQRIARDVHDDLGSGLSALSLQTAMAQYKTTPEEIKFELEKINSAARDLSGKIREVIWTVNSKNDTLANLISYLNQYALDLLESTEIDILVNLPDEIPEATVTGEYRRTTFLAFKEALNNMLKHANASQVEINFKADNDSLQIEVADNGVGFDPQLLLASTGNGLLNMRTRMKEIGGDCRYKTSGGGSKVTFVLRLKPA